MVRLTVRELSDLLGQKKHWLYHVLRSINGTRDHKIIDEDLIYGAFKYAVLVRHYDSFDYSRIADSSYKNLVLSTKVVNFKDKLGEIDNKTFAELVIAIKAVRPAYKTFNVISYLILKLNLVSSFRDYLKEYIYLKFVKQCIYMELDINYILPIQNIGNKELELEVLGAIRKRMVQDLNIKSKEVKNGVSATDPV